MFKQLEVECDKCGKTNKEMVKVWTKEEYEGTILKSYFCNFCGVAQVVRYKFDWNNNGKPTFLVRLEPSEAFVQPQDVDWEHDI